MQVLFNTQQFLSDKFDNPDGLISIVGRHNGETPQREAVRKWFARCTVPADWWPILLTSLELECGEPISLLPYHNQGNIIVSTDIFA